jgi:Family of unknown function (DUF6318)
MFQGNLRWVAATLLAPCLVMTACSGESDPAPASPRPPPPPTSAAPPTPLASVTEPALPEAKPTPASAIAFVRYFWDAYNYAYATYDVRPMQSISLPTCSSCDTLVNNVKGIQARNMRIKGYRLSIIDIVSPNERITSGALVRATLSQEPGEARAPRQQPEVLVGFQSVQSITSLAWDGSTWRVEALSNDPKTRKPWKS